MIFLNKKKIQPKITDPYTKLILHPLSLNCIDPNRFLFGKVSNCPVDYVVKTRPILFVQIVTAR